MSWSRAVATPDEARAALADPGDALDLRAAAREGALEVAVEPTTFSLAAHRAEMEAAADDIAAFRAEQRAAFAVERADWQARGEI